MDPTMQASLQGDNPLVAWAVEIDYPTFTLRLVDGAGQITINGHTFLGVDPTYGTLNGPDTWEDGTAAEAPHLTFQILPPTNTAAAALASATAQGSPVSLWFASINRATGAVIGTPYLLWTGDIDVPTLLIGKNTRVVKIDAESAWDRFFDVDEGLLLTNACHQSFWPGELGLEYVTEVQAQIPWGQDIARPVVVTDVINGTPDYTNGVTGGAAGGVGGAVGGGIRLPSIPF
jgi:hypothetical protein